VSGKTPGEGNRKENRRSRTATKRWRDSSHIRDKDEHYRTHKRFKGIIEERKIKKIKKVGRRQGRELLIRKGMAIKQNLPSLN